MMELNCELQCPKCQGLGKPPTIPSNGDHLSRWGQVKSSSLTKVDGTEVKLVESGISYIMMVLEDEDGRTEGPTTLAEFGFRLSILYNSLALLLT